MECPLHDDRLTLAGLFFESQAGLAATLERRLETECGLTNQWFEVLLRLARSPEGRLRMSDLTAQVTLTPSGLTRAVDRLEAARLVAPEGSSPGSPAPPIGAASTRCSPRRARRASRPRCRSTSDTWTSSSPACSNPR